MFRGDAGLAHEYWKQYYTPDEQAEIGAHRTTTMFVSGQYPVHVGVYYHGANAPTVLMAHGIYVYGLALARLQLPFFRAGFNVVAWDLPGMGQSGGPRGGCTVIDFIQAWRDAFDFTVQRFNGPLYSLGVAEDAVTCYYALANNPRVRALSVHTLLQLGDYEGMHWHGPRWWMRAVTTGLRVASLALPSVTRPSAALVPWEWVFSGPGDERVIELLRHDPLGFARVSVRMASMLGLQMVPLVPFEACRTPLQVIASESNRIWRHSMVFGNYQRVSGPKQFVTLPGAGQWEGNRSFHETYAAHVVRWFEAN
jgi:pimeloyl-ACP methyl ester carboxylesterase